MFVRPIKLSLNHMPSDEYTVCTCAPVFSWSLEGEKFPLIQKAYRITVRDDEELLWDSGWVVSDEPTATYQGKELKAGMRPVWTVQVETEDGILSEEVSASFRMVPETLEGVSWITDPDAKESVPVYLGKEFFCEKPVKRATIYSAGVGYQVIRINGNLIDDAVLQPITSNYSMCVYFVTLSAEEFLKEGKNQIGVKLGDGWRKNEAIFKNATPKKIPFFGVPQLAAKLEIEYADGTCETIATDESWQVFHGGTRKDNLFDGETFDANFALSGLDGMGEIPFPGESQAILTKNLGTLIPQIAEPIKIHERIRPISKTMVEEGVYLFDFGVNIAGFCEITIPDGMKKGDAITLGHSEELATDGDLDMTTMRGADSVDEYISNGKDAGNKWHPEFLYHGFRYVRVSGWHGIPDLESITALMVHNAVNCESNFFCGNPWVNQIHQNVLQTEKNCLQGIATDCHQRDERLGWMNDGTVRFEETPYNFDMARLFPKIVEDIVLDQSEEGNITCTAPCIYKTDPTDPVCASFLVAGWKAWLHYGNPELMRKHYESYSRWADFLNRHESEDEPGILGFSHYGDWAGTADSCHSMEGPWSVVTPGSLMSTGFHYYNHKTVAEMAKILGKTEEEERHEKEAERIRQAFLKKWWNPETGVVATGSQGCQSFALWLGILPEEGRQKAADRLHDAVASIGYRLKSGNITSLYVMDMLADYGYINDAWKIITRENYPSLGYMIQNGATTIWERFEQKENKSMNSHCHPMYGAVGSWFYSRLCGLIPTDGGWSRFKIAPRIPDDLLRAEARLDTVRGDISVKWFKLYGKLHIHVQVPYGATAEYEYKDDKQTLQNGFYRFEYQL